MSCHLPTWWDHGQEREGGKGTGKDRTGRLREERRLAGGGRASCVSAAPGAAGGGEGLSLGLTPGVFAPAAEAKAAEAAASAYYNPGNPHNVYMPTVSRVVRGRPGAGR